MRIENTSPYDTRALRMLMTRVHARMSRSEGRLRTWAHLVVVVRGRHSGNHSTGRSWMDGSRMVLTLGSGDMRRVAWLFWHELQHSYGYLHRALHDAQDVDVDAICAGLPATLPLKADTRKPPAKVDVVAKRHAAAAKHLAAWLRRLKTAQRKVKDYTQRVRRYERTYGESGRLVVDAGQGR